MTDFQECPRCQRMQTTLYSDSHVPEEWDDGVCAWCLRELGIDAAYPGVLLQDVEKLRPTIQLAAAEPGGFGEFLLMGLVHHAQSLASQVEQLTHERNDMRTGLEVVTKQKDIIFAKATAEFVLQTAGSQDFEEDEQDAEVEA